MCIRDSLSPYVFSSTVLAYAATLCPVVTAAMLLCVCYGLCGTELAYDLPGGLYGQCPRHASWAGTLNPGADCRY
eukprot:1251945-Rhodomonas_salina.3